MIGMKENDGFASTVFFVVWSVLWISLLVLELFGLTGGIFFYSLVVAIISLWQYEDYKRMKQSKESEERTRTEYSIREKEIPIFECDWCGLDADKGNEISIEVGRRLQRSEYKREIRDRIQKKCACRSMALRQESVEKYAHRNHIGKRKAMENEELYRLGTVVDVISNIDPRMKVDAELTVCESCAKSICSEGEEQ